MAFVGQIHNAEQSLGTRSGGDFQQILQSLAAKKAEQVKVNQNRQILSSMGINPQIVSGLAHKDDKTIFDFLKTIPGLDVDNQNQEYIPQYEQAMERLTPEGLTQQQAQDQEMQQGQYQDPAQNRFQPGQYQVPGMGGQNRVQNKRPRLVTKATGNIAEQQLAYNMQRDIEKFERPALEQAHKEYIAALNNDKILKREEQLVKNGKLPNAVIASAIDKLNKGIFGLSIDLNSLLGSDAEEFNKLSAEMANNLRQAGGGRITNFMMENFLKSIPTLVQSDEGKKRVIENYKLFNDIKKERYLVMRQLINQNNGVTPKNLTFTASEAEDQYMQKYNDKLQRFENDFQQSPEQLERKVMKFNSAKDAIEAARKAGAKEVIDKKTGKVYKL